ncbi:response regulator [Paenibacillus whitsoniae]|uniref:Response regulator n=1 Tax=Paenibacillus whitsoniae TaxID=2496558 RepID=A0A430JL85_9BACL|nr:response regulator [Paenibacillus whitsoniae]RTE11792.1 response regulator [Paenibacillus whitsoniae]
MSDTPIRVLIVDDELPLRQELRSLPWSSFGAEFAGEAENGEEALELCEKLQPDLVVTDITMPIMNGMELFRAIKQKWPFMQVVLLTCHSDFHYAQEALKLGALDYFTKLALEEGDLQASIDKTRASLRREQDLRRYGQEQLRRELSKGIVTLSHGEAAPLTAQSQVWAAWGGSAPFYPVRLHLDAKESDRFHVLYEIERILAEAEAQPAFHWCPIGDREIVLVFADAPDEAASMAGMQRVMARLHAELEQALPYMSGAYRLMAVVGGRVAAPHDVVPALRASAMTPAQLFYGRPWTTALASEAAHMLPAPDEHPEAQALRLRWQEAAADKDALRRLYQEGLAPWAAAHRFDPDKLKAFVGGLREAASAAHAQLRHAQFDAVTAELRAAPTLTELISACLRELEHGTAEPARRVRKEVQQARRIIEQKLGEPLTLTSVSEEVGLSSYYLSRLFKEETGEAFNDYITRLRMEKAVHLLQTTQLKVYEVAEHVGIPSYRYFSQLFRNWTGVAPTEYKKG